MTAALTKQERTDLVSLVKKQERVLKSAAKRRSAELLADFERQVSAIYSFDDDEVWKAAYAEARKAVGEAREVIAKRCGEMGIPKEFAPNIDMEWYGRGSSAVAARRNELRKLAKAQIASAEASALVRIEQHGLKTQTEILASGLTSDAAKAFLENMPSVEELMPAVSAEQIQSLPKQ